MKNILIILLLLLLTGCATLDSPVKNETPTKLETSKEIDLTGAKKLKGRFTVYAAARVKSDPNGRYCLQGSNNKCVSKKLNKDKVCFLQMQGSGMVDNVKYSWARSNSVTKHSCSQWGKAYSTVNKGRFKVNNKSDSIGSFNNVLEPYKSIACPCNPAPSQRALYVSSGCKFPFNKHQRIYVPAAKGIKLPNGKIHDGIFVCHDRGREIQRKLDGSFKIDTFIGSVLFSPWKMNDWRLTSRKSPFKHTGNQNKTWDFYFLKD